MHLRIENGNLLIQLTFWEKLWSLHGSLSVPLPHVAELKHSIPVSSWKELKLPGSFVPGVIKAGTYLTPRGKEFWSVTRWAGKQVTIELRDEKYKRIVLGLPPDAVVPAILETSGKRILIASSQ